MKAPCKDCPDRAAGCHSSCEKYRAFREERDADLEMRKMLSRGEPLTSEFFIRKWKNKIRIINSRNSRR